MILDRAYLAGLSNRFYKQIWFCKNNLCNFCQPADNLIRICIKIANQVWQEIVVTQSKLFGKCTGFREIRRKSCHNQWASTAEHAHIPFRFFLKKNLSQSCGIFERSMAENFTNESHQLVDIRCQSFSPDGKNRGIICGIIIPAVCTDIEPKSSGISIGQSG